MVRFCWSYFCLTFYVSVYHLKCIDPWLTKNRRVCPVCKAKVILPGMVETESESETEPTAAATETTPLIPGGITATRGRARRGRRSRRSGPVSGATQPETEASHLNPDDASLPSSSRQASLPASSGLFSVNCDDGDNMHQSYGAASTSETPIISSTSSATTAVVVVEVLEPGGSSSTSSSRRSRRRSDAIV